MGIGLSGVLGLPALIGYVLGSTAVCYVFVYKWMGVEEDVVETKDVLKEHFMNGFFPFLLAWIITYNVLNHL